MDLNQVTVACTDYADAEVQRLEADGIKFQSGPIDQDWLWREARLLDPAGNQICIYHAGKDRRCRPWRIE